MLADHENLYQGPPTKYMTSKTVSTEINVPPEFLTETNDKLDKSFFLASQTEQMGLDTLKTLQQQREQIIRVLY